MVSIDIETSGLGFNDDLLSVGVAWRGAGGVESSSWSTGGDLFTPALTPPEIRAALLPLLAGADWVVFHNGVFDIAPLLARGVLLEHELRGKVFDTLLASRMTGARESVSLANMCKVYKLSLIHI